MEYLPGGSAQVSAAAAVGGLEPIQYPEYPEHPCFSRTLRLCGACAGECGERHHLLLRRRRPGRYLPRPGHVGPGHGHIRLCPMIITCVLRTWRSRPRPRLQCMCAPRAAACSARAWPVQWGSVGTGGCGAGWSGRVSHWYGRARLQGVTGVRLSSCLVYSTGCLPVPYPCWVWSGTRDGGRACAGLPERVV